MSDTERTALPLHDTRDFIQRLKQQDSPYAPGSWVDTTLRTLEALVAEVAEHRAARGIEAPAGWQPSTEALWERAASDKRSRDADGEVLDECPDGWLTVAAGCDGWDWLWCRDYKTVAKGTEPTVLGAIAAAEAALVPRLCDDDTEDYPALPLDTEEELKVGEP